MQLNISHLHAPTLGGKDRYYYNYYIDAHTCEFDTWNGTDTYKISNATAVVETLATLTNCSASVGEGCRVPPLDTATLASCLTSLQTVEDKNKECYELLTKKSAVSNVLFISDIICKCKM